MTEETTGWLHISKAKASQLKCTILFTNTVHEETARARVITNLFDIQDGAQIHQKVM